MAYYSTFVFQLPGCPVIEMSTRYDSIQEFEHVRKGSGDNYYYKPRRKMVTQLDWDYGNNQRISLTKKQRRKIQTFLKMIIRKSNYHIPRKYRQFVKNDGIFPTEFLQ
jgi:hypothetical protein